MERIGYVRLRRFRRVLPGHEDRKSNGVGSIANKYLKSHVMGFNPVNDGIISIRICCKPVNVTIVQVYAPTSAAEEEEIDRFYGILQDVLENVHKGDALFVMGDLMQK